MQRRGDEVQPQRRQQQAQEQPLPASHEHGHAGDDAQQRERAAPIRPADGIAQHRAGVGFQQPQRQLQRLRDRREGVGPVGLFHRLLVRRAHRVLADDQHGGKARDEDDVIDDPRQPAPRRRHRCDEVQAGEGIRPVQPVGAVPAIIAQRNHQAYSAGHEDRGKRVAHGRANQRGQAPEPARLVRPPQPLDRQGEHGQGQQQIAAVGLGLGRVAGHRIGDGEQPHGQHERSALEQSPGHVAEQQQAAQSAQERESAAAHIR